MSERFAGSVSNRKIRILRSRNYNKCIYCGKELGEKRSDISIEHVIPQAVFKWTAEMLDENELSDLKDLCKSLDNLAVVHYSCNARKSSKIAYSQDIAKFKVDKNIKDIYNNHIAKCKKYIDNYKKLRHKVAERQDFKCAECGKDLVLSESSIRRVDIDKPRTTDNAVVVCLKCNSRFWYNNREH